LPDSLRVDLPTASLALSLLERLEDFRAEVVATGGKRYQVCVELDGGANDPAREGLARIESWLESLGLNLAEIHLNDRPHRHASSDIPPLRARNTPESIGLVCRVKTIALGTGVQVVSAEGEVDLYTAPELEDLLRSSQSDHVVLDLTEAAFVDSTTMSIIVATSKRLRAEGRQLSVASGNPTVARLLEITGLDRALDVHPTLAEAVESALDSAVEEVEAHRQNESAL